MTFVKAILNANFQMEPLISMLEEVNSINYLHFLSQNKKEAVACMMKAEMKSIAKRYNGFDQSCQKQNKTALEILGMIQGMEDLVPLPVNFNMIVLALFDMKEGKPLFCKIQDHLMEFIHDGNFKNWQAGRKSSARSTSSSFLTSSTRTKSS